MRIQHWMKHPLYVIKPQDSIRHAREIMQSHRVNQLPVVVDGHLIGIITDRDVRDAFPSVFESSELNGSPPPALSDPAHISVEMVMTPNVLTLTPENSMDEAIRIMRRERIGALPILEHDRLVGILTRSDLLDCFESKLGDDDTADAALHAAKGSKRPASKPA